MKCFELQTIHPFELQNTRDALAAVAVTTTAMAQVTVYGRLDVGHESVKVTNDAGESVKTTTLAGKQDGRTGSRFGFTGKEDLGNGISAGFVYEQSVNVDRAAGTGDATRQANLSLSGGFGTIAIGTYNNVFDDMTGAAVTTHTGNFVLTPGRSQNAIGYSTPNMGGLVLGVGMSNEKEDDNGDVTKASGMILSARYNAGPLSVLAGYSSAKASELTGADDEDYAEAKFSEFATKITYNLGVAVPYFVYSNGKLKGELNGDSAKVTSVGNEFGVNVPMGNFSPFVAVASAKYKADGTQFAKYSGNSFGTTYSFSKRTTAYAQMSEGKFSVADDTWEKTKTTRIGLIHTF